MAEAGWRLAARGIAAALGCAAYALPAFAQTSPAAPAAAPPAQTQPAPAPPAPAAPPPSAPKPADAGTQPAEVHNVTVPQAAVLGQVVHGSDGQEVGRIIDILVDQHGKPLAAVIDSGGFMGVGDRQVAVDWTKLHFDPQNPKTPVSIDLTPQQVQAAPEFKGSTTEVTVVGPPGKPAAPQTAPQTTPQPAPSAAPQPAAPAAPAN